METHFELITRQNQRDYQAFGEVMAKHQHVPTVYLVGAILFFVLGVIGAFSDIGTPLFCFSIGIVWLVLYVMGGKRVGNQSWMLRNPLWDMTPETYTFDDDFFQCRHQLAASTVSYRLLIDVVETEEYFVLLESKSKAFILPKTGFTKGTPDEFRQFIALKIGKTLTWQPVQKQKTRRIVTAVAIGAAALVLAAGITLLQEFNRPATVTSADGSSSLTVELPLTVGEMYNEDGVAYFCNAAVDVYVTHYTLEELHDEMQMHPALAVTRSDYAEYLQSIEYVDPEGEWIPDDKGVWCMEYTQFETYCHTALIWLEDGCYLVDFSCYEEDREQYAPKFNAWCTNMICEGD